MIVQRANARLLAVEVRLKAIGVRGMGKRSDVQKLSDAGRVANQTGIDSALVEAIAAKVRFLFAYCRKPNGDTYTYNEVEMLSNGKVTNSTLSKLARGQIARPSVESLTRLTDFFGIDPGYWFTPLDEGLKVRVQMEHGSAQVRAIAARASALPSEEQTFLLNVIEALEKKHGDTASAE